MNLCSDHPGAECAYERHDSCPACSLKAVLDDTASALEDAKSEIEEHKETIAKLEAELDAAANPLS